MKLQESNTNFVDDLFPPEVPIEVRTKFIMNSEQKFLVCDYEPTGRRFIMSGTLIKTDLNNTLKPGITVYYRKCDCKLLTTKSHQVMKYKDSNILYVSKVYTDITACPPDVENETKWVEIEEEEIAEKNTNGGKTSRKTSKYSRVKSFVYANIEYINDLENF